jgi:hypothetical protein
LNDSKIEKIKLKKLMEERLWNMLENETDYFQNMFPNLFNKPHENLKFHGFSSHF